MRFVLKHFQTHFETLFSHMLGYLFLKNLCEMVFRYACKHSHINETGKRNQTIFQLNWPSDHLHFMPFMCWFIYIERERQVCIFIHLCSFKEWINYSFILCTLLSQVFIYSRLFGFAFQNALLFLIFNVSC